MCTVVRLYVDFFFLFIFKFLILDLFKFLILDLLDYSDSSGYSGFLPQSNDMHVRLIGGYELPVGVIVSVHGCSSICGFFFSFHF